MGGLGSGRHSAWVAPPSPIAVRTSPCGQYVAKGDLITALGNPPQSLLARWSFLGFPRSHVRRKTNHSFYGLSSLAWLERRLGLVFEMNTDDATHDHT